MSNSYTPGPWVYQASTRTIRKEPNNYWLATMDSWDGAVNHEANARLIASAPDLAEALRALTDWGRENTSPTDANCPHDLLIAAQAALARAGA